jgi:zinc/manganese transport system substrate-binding protein
MRRWSSTTAEATTIGVEDVLSSHHGVAAVNAYSLLPTSAPQPANEHVFYDLETVKAVANQIADKLSQSDADHTNDYKANASRFADQADTIATAERAIGASHPRASVVATEPVAHYLVVNSGIVDKTPEGFTKAIEQDTDPSPARLGRRAGPDQDPPGVGAGVQLADPD